MNFSSDLIKFEDYIKKLLNSLWIRPIFTIIPLNSSESLKIGKFGIIFDAIPRDIDDLVVSSRHMTTIFSNYLGDNLDIFMYDFSIFGDDFHSYLAHLRKILRCESRND